MPLEACQNDTSCKHSTTAQVISCMIFLPLWHEIFIYEKCNQVETGNHVFIICKWNRVFSNVDSNLQQGYTKCMHSRSLISCFFASLKKASRSWSLRNKLLLIILWLSSESKVFLSSPTHLVAAFGSFFCKNTTNAFSLSVWFLIAFICFHSSESFSPKYIKNKIFKSQRICFLMNSPL